MRVLSLVHGPDARSGLFGETVTALGHELEERSFAFGTPPPKPPEEYDAVMIFGGAMNVHEHDSHPWLLEELSAIRRLLEREVPTLGVCLGAQLLASAAGAEVSRAPAPEIGWHEVELTPEASRDPLFAELPERFTAYQWHSYQFSVPERAVPLARSAVCVQAYRLGESAWGTQFHAEVTPEIVESWISAYGTDPDAVRLGFDCDRERERLREEIERWNRFGRSFATAFVDAAASYGASRGEPARA